MVPGYHTVVEATVPLGTVANPLYGNPGSVQGAPGTGQCCAVEGSRADPQGGGEPTHPLLQH